eukprot:6187228-Pleurochrysis_carterae.AAC.1
MYVTTRQRRFSSAGGSEERRLKIVTDAHTSEDRKQGRAESVAYARLPKLRIRRVQEVAGTRRRCLGFLAVAHPHPLPHPVVHNDDLVLTDLLLQPCRNMGPPKSKRAERECRMIDNVNLRTGDDGEEDAAHASQEASIRAGSTERGCVSAAARTLTCATVAPVCALSRPTVSLSHCARPFAFIVATKRSTDSGEKRN